MVAFQNMTINKVMQETAVMSWKWKNIDNTNKTE